MPRSFVVHRAVVVAHGVEGPRAAAVHENLCGLGRDGVSKVLERDADVRGVPQEKLADLPWEDPQEVRLELRVRRFRTSGLRVFLFEVLELRDTFLHRL